MCMNSCNKYILDIGISKLATFECKYNKVLNEIFYLMFTVKTFMLFILKQIFNVFLKLLMVSWATFEYGPVDSSNQKLHTLTLSSFFMQIKYFFTIKLTCSGVSILFGSVKFILQ